MDVAANPVGAGFVELVAQQLARLLQAEVRAILTARPEDMDVVYDVIVVGEVQAIADREGR